MTADRSRWIALYVLCVGMLMIVLDVTVVNVALPSIQNDLGFSTSSLAWVVNGYLISFGGLLLLDGHISSPAGVITGRTSIPIQRASGHVAATSSARSSESQSIMQ